MDTSNWINIAVTIVGFLAFYLGFVKQQDEKISKQGSAIIGLQKDNETFWKIIGPAMAGIIHSPEHQRRDYLVDALVHGKTSISETREVAALLDDNINANHDKMAVMASALLRALAENRLDKTLNPIQAGIVAKKAMQDAADAARRAEQAALVAVKAANDIKCAAETASLKSLELEQGARRAAEHAAQAARAVTDIAHVD